jgi:geranylgeranyl transferase type-2 subunit alpha
MSHDRPRIRKEDIDMQKENVKKLKIKEFIAFKDKLIAARSEGIFDLSVLDQLDKGVLISSDINTLWNYRKQILCHVIQCELDQGRLPWITDQKPNEQGRILVVNKHRDSFPYDLDENIWQLHKNEKIRELLERELTITERVLRERNVKSYGCWYHRKWCIKHLPHMWERDLKLTELLLASDERNFHCWNYRRYVLTLAKFPPSEELDFTLQKIYEKPSNYSAWHNRSSLLWENNRIQGEPMKDVLEREFSLVQNQLFTDPYDQSAWIYHRWLLQTPESKDILEMDLQTCKELMEIEKDCKWVLLTIVLNYMQGNQQLTHEIQEEVLNILDKLMLIDKMHVHYYEDVKSDFRIRSELEKQQQINKNVLTINNSGLTRIDGLNKCNERMTSNLTHLNLSNNSIRFIASLNNAANIEVLNLSHNNIEFVEKLEQFEVLKELDLSYNQISRLVLEQSPLNNHVTLVNMAGNPITDELSESELRNQLKQLFPNAVFHLA